MADTNELNYNCIELKLKPLTIYKFISLSFPFAKRL